MTDLNRVKTGKKSAVYQVHIQLYHQFKLSKSAGDENKMKQLSLC